MKQANYWDFTGSFVTTQHAPLDIRSVVDNLSDLTSDNWAELSPYSGMLVSVLETRALYMLKSDASNAYKNMDNWQFIGGLDTVETANQAASDVSTLNASLVDVWAKVEELEGGQVDAKFEYSVDKNSWHDTVSSDDYFMRISYDGGATWTEGILIKGEQETSMDTYTNFMFAWSAQDSGNPPTDITEWTDAVPDSVSGKEYLWAKIERIENGEVINWKYIRMTGKNGANGQGIESEKSLGNFASDSAAYSFMQANGKDTNVSGWWYIRNGGTDANLEGWMIMYMSDNGGHWVSIGPFKGADGENGVDGLSMIISCIEEKYAASSDGENPPAKNLFVSYDEAIEDFNITNKYLWNYEVYTMKLGEDGEETLMDTYTAAHVVCIMPEDGKSWELQSVTEYYAVSGSISSKPELGDNWKSFADITGEWNASNPYLWNYEVYNESTEVGIDDISTYNAAKVVAIFTTDGQDGQDGNSGRGIESIEDWYIALDEDDTNAPEADDEGWNKTFTLAVGACPDWKVIWNKTVITYSDGTASEPKINLIAAKGENGVGLDTNKNITEEIALAEGYTPEPGQWFIEEHEDCSVNLPEGGEPREYGHVYAWIVNDGEEGHWAHLGQFTGRPGENGTSNFVHVKFADEVESGTANAYEVEEGTFIKFTGSNGDVPGDWFGVYVSESSTAETGVSDYNKYSWKCIKGEKGKDGYALEYIFTRSASEFNNNQLDCGDPSKNQSMYADYNGKTFQDDNYVPNGWYDDYDDNTIPIKSMPFCYRTYRKRNTDGTWGNWHKAQLYEVWETPFSIELSNNMDSVSCSEGKIDDGDRQIVTRLTVFKNGQAYNMSSKIANVSITGLEGSPIVLDSSAWESSTNSIKYVFKTTDEQAFSGCDIEFELNETNL